MSPAPLFRTSIAALATVGGLCVATTSGYSQIRRTTGTLATPVVAEPTTVMTLEAATPPAGPAPTVAVSGHGITAQVTWQPLTGVANYTVERWLEANATCCRVQSPALTTTSWGDTGLEWPGTYVYRVFANYADGRQGVATFNFVRPTPQDPPAASFKAHSPGPGGVQLSWSAVPGVTKYFVGGPGAGPNGLEVTGTSTTLQGIPAGRQQWSVASMYTPGGLITPWREWPTVALDMPVFGVFSARLLYENSAMIDLTIPVVRDATNIRIFRLEGVSTTPTLIPTPISRSPLGAGDLIRARIVFTDMKPQAQYRFYFVAAVPNLGDRESGQLTLSIPLLNVQTTVPASGDRIIVEWNAFGSAPYTLEKGTPVQQGGGNYIAYQPVRDASGNPMSFTSVLRYEDLVVQKGKTYYYKVCATIPNGSACPTAYLKMQ